MKTILILLMGTMVAHAQLAVTLSPVKVTGQKAIMPLVMKNSFAEKVESARATVFLFDDQGKMAGQATRWVIGGKKNSPSLAPGKETTFNFVITTDKPFKTHRVTFTRLILEGGKSVDPIKNVQIQQSNGGP